MIQVECKGGFPRIYVYIDKKEKKEEQGFGIKSIKDMMKIKKTNSIGLQQKIQTLNIVGGSDNINGIPISMIIGK